MKREAGAFGSYSLHKRLHGALLTVRVRSASGEGEVMPTPD